MTFRRKATAVTAVLMLAAPSQGAASMGTRDGRGSVLDASRPGRYNVEQLDYQGRHVILQDRDGVPIAQDLKGSIHLPDAGGGPWPVIVFVHGRYVTCRIADAAQVIGVYPCPDAYPVTSDIPSYRGFDYLASNLASHGFVVASISTDAINAYDFPLSARDSGIEWRAQLVGETLDQLNEWSLGNLGPGEIGRTLAGKLDFDHIGLMGHSRGGEAVARFVTSNRTRTSGPTYDGLEAVFALAPTDLYDEQVPGVQFGTLLPTCDGDVFDLQGAWMFEDAIRKESTRFVRVQFAVTGANHTFFNTVWTTDDGASGGTSEGSNPACDPAGPGNVRLEPSEQRAIGLNLIAAFFRRYVADDRSMEGLMTGAATPPESACALACRRTVLTSYVAPARDRDFILRAGDRPRYEVSGALEVARCEPARGGGTGCPSEPNRSPAPQLTLTWTKRGSMRIPLPRPLDVRRYRSFTFRTAVNFSYEGNPERRSQQLDVTFVDAAGRRASAAAAAFGGALEPPAGPRFRAMVLNGVRIPLGAFRGIDMGAISAVELRVGRVTRRGSIQLTDVAFQERL